MVDAEAMKGGQVIRLHAECLILSAPVVSLALLGCNSIAEAPVIDARAVEVVGTVQSAQLSSLGGEISLLPDPTGNCPASESQSTSHAPPVVAPVEPDGSFAATILVDYTAGNTPPQTICVHVAVFLEQDEEVPDSVFSAGPWTLGSEESPPTEVLLIVF